MALQLTSQQAKVLISFRRSNMARDLYAVAVEILDTHRAEYEDTSPASEALRAEVNGAKRILDILFEGEISI